MPEPSSPSMPASAKRLPRSVWILSWISFFADVSSEMVYPILPLFMAQVLHSSKSQLGLMEGTAVFLVALMSAYAGFQSDRNGPQGGRVKWIRIGYGMPVLGKAIIAVSTMWPLVMGGRLFDRFGKGLRGVPAYESVDGGEYKLIGTANRVLAKVKEGTVLNVHGEGDDNLTRIEIGTPKKK